MKRKLKIIAMFSLVVAMIISLNASTLVGSIFANENDTDKMLIQIERDNEKDVYVDDILNYTITIKNQSEKSIMDSQIDLHLSDGLRLQEESILIDQKNSNKVSLDEKTGMYQISIGNKDEEKFVMSGNSTTILTFSAQMVNTGTQEIKTALMGSVDVEEIHKLIENKDSVTILEKEQASEKENIEESKGIISNENTLEEIANIYSVMYDENKTKATIQFDFQYLDKKGVEVENLICTKDNVVLFDKETKDNHLSYEVLGNGIVEFNMVYRNKDDINKKKHNKTFTVTVDKLDTSLKDITFKQEKQELNVDEAIVNTVIGEISSKEKDIVYKMEDSKNSKLFSVNQDGTVSLREDIHNAGDYTFSVIASKGEESVEINKTLTVRAVSGTNPVKWKVIYKDANNHGVVMPVKTILKRRANSTGLDNTVQSYSRDGKDYANAYLVSDLFKWTYETFATSISNTVSDAKYSDPKGKSILANNPYLSNVKDMSDYTTSSVYNLPYETGTSYTTSNTSFTYPNKWIGAKNIASAHGHGNITFSKDPDPLLSSDAIYFGSTPLTTTIHPGWSSAVRELLAITENGSFYDPYYSIEYSYRPALYIDDLGDLSEYETFTLGAITDSTSWNVIPEITDSNITFSPTQRVPLADAIVGKTIGTVKSNVTGVTYAIVDKDSASFKIDANGNIMLNKAITKEGTYTYSVAITKGNDTVVVHNKVIIGNRTIQISKISDGLIVGEYASFDEVNKGITTKDEYQIRIMKDYILTGTETDKLNEFLNTKTTRFIISGLQDDGKTTSKLTFSKIWLIGGQNNTEGNVVENLKIKTSANLAIFANGNKTIFGDNLVMDTDGTTKTLSLFGGGDGKDVNETNLIIKSGSFHYVIGGSHNGDVINGSHVTLEGGSVSTLSLGSVGAVGNVYKVGNTSSKSIMEVKGGTITKYIYLVSAYGDGAEWSGIPVGNVYPGVILGDVEVNLNGGTIAAVKSICIPYKKSGDMSNRGYIDGNLTFNISGDVNIKNYSLKEEYGSKGVGGVYTVNITGQPTLPITFGASLGKRITKNTTVLNFMNKCNVPNTTFLNFDQVNVDEASNTSLSGIASATLVGVKDTVLTLKNNSMLIFGVEKSVVGDLVGGAKENSLNSPFIKVPKGYPLSVSNSIDENSIFQVTETGTPAQDDILIHFTDTYHANATNVFDSITFFKKGIENVNIAERKDTKDIVVCDKTFTAELTKVIQSNFAIGNEGVKKELTMEASLTNGDDTYIYGEFLNDTPGTTPSKSCGYISTNEAFDENWMKTEIIPTGGTEVYFALPENNTIVAASQENIQIEEDNKYYLHLRTTAQDYLVIPLDFHDIQADLDTSVIPKQDAEGIKYEIKLADKEFNDGTPSYVSSGVYQVAYSLVKDNVNALSDTLEEHAGTEQQLFGIQTWTSGNISEDYTLTIPQEIIDKMKNKDLSVVYLYAKDKIGNTCEVPIYVGEDLMGVRVATKASVYALKGKSSSLIAPTLTLTNFGKQKVNIDIQMKSYSDKADTLSLVNDKTTYADNELALSLLPQENAAFTKTNVRNIEAAPFNIGSIDIMNKANLDNIRFTFEAAYDAEKIDGTLEANTFTLEYYLTPVK